MKGKAYFAVLALVLALAFGFPAGPAEARTEGKRFAFELINSNADQIALIGNSLFYFGEPGMQEYESAKFLKETLEGIGFTVEMGGAGMPTNVWAKWGSGKPVVLIATEIDALPEGSQTPGVIERKPLVPGGPRTHGRAQYDGGSGGRSGLRREEGHGAVQDSWHCSDFLRTRRGADPQPPLSGSGWIF
jgi:aminobenzoyl-glutamate utilization protein B